MLGSPHVADVLILFCSYKGLWNLLCSPHQPNFRHWVINIRQKWFRRCKLIYRSAHHKGFNNNLISKIKGVVYAVHILPLCLWKKQWTKLKGLTSEEPCYITARVLGSYFIKAESSLHSLWSKTSLLSLLYLEKLKYDVTINDIE